MRIPSIWVAALACLGLFALSCGPGQSDVQTSWYSNPINKRIFNSSFFFHDGDYYIVEDDAGRLYIQSVKEPADADFKKMRMAADMISEYGLTDLWYPQLTMIDGKWYIYVTADDGNTDNHKMYVLSCDGDNPLKDRWRLAGRLVTDKNDNWAIHGHVFKYRERLYMIWSGWQSRRIYAETQNIYISEMISPTELSGERTLISTPEYEWELQWIQRDGDRPIRYPVFVNELPFFFAGDKTDKAYIFYSASAHWTANCCIGELWAEKDADLLNASSWHKTPHPVFSENREAAIYGPSAPAIITSPDGKDAFLLYSATDTDKTAHTRSLYMQPISFSPEGHPEFGKPLSRDVRLPRISSTNPHI